MFIWKLWNSIRNSGLHLEVKISIGNFEEFIICLRQEKLSWSAQRCKVKHGLFVLNYVYLFVLTSIPYVYIILDAIFQKYSMLFK